MPETIAESKLNGNSSLADLRRRIEEVERQRDQFREALICLLDAMDKAVRDAERRLVDVMR